MVSSMSARERFIHSLTPLELRSGVRLKNRVVFTAMGLDLADAEGRFSEQLAEFYAGIADGQVAAVILANSSVTSASRLHTGGLILEDQQQGDALKAFVHAVASKGCIPIVQLQHYGPQGSAELTNVPMLAPSIAVGTKPGIGELKSASQADIDELVYLYRRAALLAESAGVQAVQIQAGNGYLLSRFLSPYSNQRTDCYGGDIWGRSRLVREIVEAVRNALKPTTAVSVRMNVDDCIAEGGISLDDVIACVSYFAAAKVDLIELTCCVKSSFRQLLSPSTEFLNRLRGNVQQVAQISSVPIAFSGGTASLREAEDLLEAGVCDIIGFTRALFADNDLLPKTLAGAEDSIDRCRFDGNCFRDKSNPNAARVYCCVSRKYPRPAHINYK